MLKQIYEPIVKSTTNQIKKHYSQFTEEEMDYLKERVSQIQNKVFLSYHLQDKKNNVDLNLIKEILNNREYDIIEYNEVIKENYINHRVLIRSKDSYYTEFIDKAQGTIHKIKCNACFVVSIDNGIIVTAYMNKIDDIHNTINWYRYDENLDIIKGA